MEVELFTVYLGEGCKIRIDISEEIEQCFGINLDEMKKNFDSKNLIDGIRDFTTCLEAIQKNKGGATNE